MHKEEIGVLLNQNGLRVTPQRVAIFEAVKMLKNHPTAEDIIAFIRINHPSLSTGTVYKTLDTFVEKGIFTRVRTDRDIMRYDSIADTHHHLYCADSDRVEDYFDDELNLVLHEYFKKRNIPGFSISDVKLQIMGNFIE